MARAFSTGCWRGSDIFERWRRGRRGQEGRNKCREQTAGLFDNFFWEGRRRSGKRVEDVTLCWERQVFQDRHSIIESHGNCLIRFCEFFENNGGNVRRDWCGLATRRTAEASATTAAHRHTQQAVTEVTQSTFLVWFGRCTGRNDFFWSVREN